MPTLGLGYAFGLTVFSLWDDLLGLTQGFVDRQFHLISQGCHLALNGVDWLDYDGALSVDGLSHSTELSGMGITPSLYGQLLAFLGKGLFQADTSILGNLNQFLPSDFQQTAVCGVINGFQLHR